MYVLPTSVTLPVTRSAIPQAMGGSIFGRLDGGAPADRSLQTDK